MRWLRQLLFLFAPAACALAAEPVEPRSPDPIVWDKLEKTVVARLGDSAADFQFTATNTSAREVTIISARPSCGCTLVDLPVSPWVLAPGASGVLRATVDFSGKEGLLQKSIAVTSTAGE